MTHNTLENCHSIEQVVALINEELATDASAERVAAEYAWGGAEESGYTDNANIEAQLDTLAEAGAAFDFRDAFKLAIALRPEALTGCGQ